jgi:predicted RNA polymerase sigma factor
VDSSSAEIHYVRGQVLVRLGRKDEGKKELDAAVRIRAKQEQNATVPSPELLQDQ